MNSNPEQRHKARFEHEAPITLETIESGIIHKARMYNYSANGMYFESDHRLSPGAEVFIGIDNSPYQFKSSTYECYRAEIKWRKELEDSAFYYGYGVFFLDKASRQDGALSKGDSRRHPRKSCSIKCNFTDQKQLQQGVIENISIGGIFIKTDNPLAVGKTFALAIPVNNKKKVVKRTGKVVWSEPNGFGVRFLDKQQTR